MGMLICLAEEGKRRFGELCQLSMEANALKCNDKKATGQTASRSYCMCKLVP